MTYIFSRSLDHVFQLNDDSFQDQSFDVVLAVLQSQIILDINGWIVFVFLWCLAAVIYRLVWKQHLL